MEYLKEWCNSAKLGEAALDDIKNQDIQESQEPRAQARKDVPAVRDFVKLSAVVGKLSKFYYGSVSVFLVFNFFLGICYLCFLICIM